jgi:hypothetical protein
MQAEVGTLPPFRVSPVIMTDYNGFGVSCSELLMLSLNLILQAIILLLNFYGQTVLQPAHLKIYLQENIMSLFLMQSIAPRKPLWSLPNLGDGIEFQR